MERFKNTSSYTEICEWLEQSARYMAFSGGIYYKEYIIDSDTVAHVQIGMDSEYIIVSHINNIGEILDMFESPIKSEWLEDKGIFIDEVDRILEPWITKG